MAFLTSGGSTATSATIVDNEIVNADINSAAAIAQSKIAAQANNNTDIVSIESTSGTTHSLTTVAGQKVTVFAFFQWTGIGSGATLSLAYNAVTKHSMSVTGDNTWGHSGCLSYSEVPGAATANITVSAPSGANCQIIVIKTKA